MAANKITLSNMQLAYIRLQTKKGESITVREAQSLLAEIDQLRESLTAYNDLTDKMIWFMEREGVLEKWMAGNPDWDASRAAQTSERETMIDVLGRLVDLLGQRVSSKNKEASRKREQGILEAWLDAVEVLNKAESRTSDAALPTPAQVDEKTGGDNAD